jgi:hypothetical protein
MTSCIALHAFFTICFPQGGTLVNRFRRGNRITTTNMSLVSFCYCYCCSILLSVHTQSVVRTLPCRAFASCIAKSFLGVGYLLLVTYMTRMRAPLRMGVLFPFFVLTCGYECWCKDVLCDVCIISTKCNAYTRLQIFSCAS